MPISEEYAARAMIFILKTAEELEELAKSAYKELALSAVLAAKARAEGSKGNISPAEFETDFIRLYTSWLYTIRAQFTGGLNAYFLQSLESSAAIDTTGDISHGAKASLAYYTSAKASFTLKYPELSDMVEIVFDPAALSHGDKNAGQ